MLNAATYSWAGLRTAFRNEAAFRQETWLILIGIPLAFWLEESANGRAIMIGALFLVLITELLNSAIEATIDRISLDNHPLSKRAKDIGSAAVLLSLIATTTVWLLILAA